MAAESLGPDEASHERGAVEAIVCGKREQKEKRKRENLEIDYCSDTMFNVILIDNQKEELRRMYI